MAEKIYSHATYLIETGTTQTSIEDFNGAKPTEECTLFGCNTYGCLSSGKCEG